MSFRKEKSRKAGTNRQSKKQKRNHAFTHMSIAERASEIKDSLLPADYYTVTVERFAPRRESGWNVTGLCPFHNDTHPGSLSINLDSGAFRCFACGASGGDVIDFHRQLNDINFIEAVTDLEEGNY